MKYDDLETKKCVPCEGEVAKISLAEAERLLVGLVGWNMTGDRIEKAWEFKNFVAAMTFVNRVAELAEREGHHPDIVIHYNKVRFTLWTHAIGGLSLNDFILAAKMNHL